MSKPTIMGAIRNTERREYPYRQYFTRYVWTFRRVRGELERAQFLAVALKFINESTPYSRVVMSAFYTDEQGEFLDIHFLVLRKHKEELSQH